MEFASLFEFYVPPSRLVQRFSSAFNGFFSDLLTLCEFREMHFDLFLVVHCLSNQI